jgi:ATP-dependent DNA helicase RecG
VSNPPFDDSLIDSLLSRPESLTFDCKRLGKIDKILETVVAFANAQGGVIALGFEDPDKAQGRDRVYGIQTQLTNWDELRRKFSTRITEPDQLPLTWNEVACTLRDGTVGSIIIIKIRASRRVHSIVENGTFVRLDKSNKELTAIEINNLMYERGVVSAESQIENIDFELLDTDYWRQYATKRKLTRAIDQAMYHVGLAKKDQLGELRPLRAAVLLFAEDPSGLLGGKTAIRLFHYRGTEISTDPNTNLVRPPISINGPLIRQITDARDAIIRELSGGVQYGPLGFEIIQRYPVRVIAEAITNAVIHRDYRLPSDIIVKVFSDHIEIESPGLLVGPVSPSNINRVGSYSRNSILVQHLREFPNPPNLDAGEGVPMMFGTMRDAGLYPPLYTTRPRIPREAVRVYLLNENRPSIWEQVTDYLEKHGEIGNAEVRQLMHSEDTLRASKMLKSWVEQGLLEVSNPDAGRNVRRYRRPTVDLDDFFSNLLGKEPDITP